MFVSQFIIGIDVYRRSRMLCLHVSSKKERGPTLKVVGHDFVGNIVVNQTCSNLYGTLGPEI